MYYVNPNIKNVVRYSSNKSRYGYYRYDMNENPEGLPEEFIADVLKEITPELLACYPETQCFIEKYSKFINVSSENIAVTNGSDMAIRYILEIFAKPGGEVVTVYPSFEMYRVNCSILGLKHIPVEYEDNFEISIEKIINVINSKTDVVVLLNPNNPIGNVYTEDEISKVILKAKEVEAIVIIDEAYHYYCDKTFIENINLHDNVIILRTFSKLFSIAGCRLGTIVSNSSIIRYINNSRLSFDVNAIALKFGEKILDSQDIIIKLIESEREGKKYLVSELKNKGYEVKVGEGNFVFIKPNNEPEKIAYILKEEEKLLVKTYDCLMLQTLIRVSTGSINSMKIFLEKFIRHDKIDW